MKSAVRLFRLTHVKCREVFDREKKAMLDVQNVVSIKRENA